MRFARRQAISKKVNPALTGALLLTGTIYAGGGTFLTVNLVPFDPADPPAPPSLRAWEAVPLWDIGDPADRASIERSFA